MVLAVEDCVQFREEVQITLDDLIQGQKEAQAEVTKILDCPTVREAQQLLLIHQVMLDIDFLILIVLKSDFTMSEFEYTDTFSMSYSP